MVKQVLTMMHREVRGLHQAAYILAVFTFGSQLLALVRDRMLAHEFGAGIELDLYYTAFRIPDILYVIFASTLSVYVLIPFVTERLEKESVDRARALLSQIFSLFLALYVIIALFAFVFAPQIVNTFFAGFSEHESTLSLLIRILLLQPLFLGVSSLLGVVTQIRHRFVVYGIGPLIYNLGIIAGLLFLYPSFGLTGLVIGVVFGAAGHLCIQLPYALQTSLVPRPTLRFEWPVLKRVFRTSCARALTLSLHQLVLLALIGFATTMSTGSVSVFQFAFNLQSVPLAIIGVSYSVAAFPILAQLYAEKRMDVFGTYITNTLKHIFFWSLPVIALFVVVRAQFVRVILGSGAFDWSDTRLTAAVLAVFSISLTAQAIHLLMVRALYAIGDTRTPFYVTLGSSCVALMGAAYFYAFLMGSPSFGTNVAALMRLENVEGIEVLALPLGYSIALILHSVVILIIARKRTMVSLGALAKPFVQSFLSALFAGYIAYTVLNYIATVREADTLITIFAQGACAVILGGVAFAVMQYLLKNKELKEVGDLFKKRFLKKSEVVAPQDEDHLSV